MIDGRHDQQFADLFTGKPGAPTGPQARLRPALSLTFIAILAVLAALVLS